MEGKAVDWYSDVFDIVFPNLDRGRANSIWSEVLKKPAKDKGDDKDDD
jgi:Lon-like ATP-dependent protease